MDRLLQGVQIKINEKLYLKDPESSDLGKKIIETSIQMINEMGFENFTFKKLGLQIGSNESSIYRYFENKHKLLIYLTSWYWGWMEYQLVFATNSIKNSKEKLLKAILIMTREIKEDSAFSHINEVALNTIVINEYSKSYLTKEVDAENREGYFVIYKRLIGRLRDMIKEVNTTYQYPSSLASTILENGLHQYFLKEHFPSLTDCNEQVSPTQYLTHLVFNTLNQDLHE
ncbi:TetR/AcrR family transcriptional regulator [Maribacter hydrothermalis]|uniref:TetR family transcriptional regulator n=1 Tax=Maribacter hydrothermalis TaxID=1836467 RepID=A0A1B7Z3Q4_9FLAO|nr:TetR/AcrR family transcriptional regulator [Maribacter hydrothermalis]APQ17035.1 TetR family transcriptional regulator [Maribacter hydrothermalis]OBR37296.1 TetR family transcriptional regulator [Maribacter hydrothermalis]